MLKSRDFKRRRKHLLRQLDEQSVVIVKSAPTRVRNRDVEYPFRQDSDFHYLTGFLEPDAVAVLLPGRKEGEYVLFCRPFDPEKAIWTGRHAGLEGAVEDHGADQALPIDAFEETLPTLLQGRKRIYFAMGADTALDQTVMAALQHLKQQVRTGVETPETLHSLEALLHEMRLVKSDKEISLMQKAADVTVKGHLRAMQFARPGVYEYQVEAELVHEFAKNGLRSQAYPSIVASGTHACVLHYTENNDRLQSGDLLLIDAGAEYENYAADVTRTFPVNGRFSEPQRLLYRCVLKAQLAAIDAVRPGNHWNQPHEAAVKVLTRGLVDLGLLEGKVSTLIREEAYKPFFMHRTGHWLGMDVHDVGAYKIGGAWRTLKPGMVLTVEPGLYIQPGCPDVDPIWHGIGIRIEDDVLVTETGHRVLTAGLPKDPDAIEALMAGRRR